MGTLRRNMAKKSKARRAKASEMKMGTTAGATQRKFEVAQYIAGGVGPANPTNVIQVDRCLNNVNRRLYRQHKVYRVKVGLSSPNENVTTSPTGGPVNVYALRNTWAVRKAISLAKDIYDTAVTEERAVVGASRWHDFRINTAGGAGGLTGPLNYPLGLTGLGKAMFTEGTAADGEYEYSQVMTTDPSGAGVLKQFGLATSSTGGEYSVFDEYQKMGPTTDESPLFVAQGGYDRATGDTFETENVQDLLNKGNLPPYDAGDLGFGAATVGGMLVKVGEIGRSNGGGNTGTLRLSTDYFDAPLGLVIVTSAPLAFGDENTRMSLDTQSLEIEVAAGDYKGVMAHDI
jgi:hypothetical protein